MDSGEHLSGQLCNVNCKGFIYFSARRFLEDRITEMNGQST